MRTIHAFGEVTTQFNSIAKYQNRFLAREILIFIGERKIFSASVDTIEEMSASDPALTPASDAAPIRVEEVEVGAGLSVGSPTKMQVPLYPATAKNLNQHGTVVLRALIGIDGKVQDLDVISTPSDSLAAAALDAVSHWEYKPYEMNGVRVRVETIVDVTFSIGR